MSGWDVVWAGAQALWPADFGAGSPEVQSAWQHVLADEMGFAPDVVGRALKSLSLRLPKLPSLAVVIAEARDLRDRETRQDMPKLAAPRSVVGAGVEAFVASMRTDRARQRTELTDLVRKGVLTAEQLPALRAQIDRVGPAEAVAYRVCRDGADLSWGPLLAAAERRGETYPDVDAFLAHEAAPVAPEPEPQGGIDRAVTPDPVMDELVAGEELQRRAQELVDEMREHGTRSIDWPSVPADVREKARVILAAARQAEGVQ